MHDLNETNPGLTLFSAELPWCCFCAEIKVLEMERNFAETFYAIKEKYWSQEPSEGGTWVGTTHQGMPPIQACPGGLSPPGGPIDPKTDAIKSYFSKKKIKEKELSRSTRQSRCHLLFFIGRPDLESVLGLRRGGSLIFAITNISPSPIP